MSGDSSSQRPSPPPRLWTPTFKGTYHPHTDTHIVTDTHMVSARHGSPSTREAEKKGFSKNKISEALHFSPSFMNTGV